MDELRARLDYAMTQQFRKELKGSNVRVQDAIAPYTRFVRAEQEHTDVALARITSMENEVHTIGQAVEHMGS
jgi:hypothetical protein